MVRFLTDSSLLRRDVVEDALKALLKAFVDLIKYSKTERTELR